MSTRSAERCIDRGDIAVANGRPSEAATHFNEAIALLDQIDSHPSLAPVLVRLSRCLLNTDSLEGALRCATRAVASAPAIDVKGAAAAEIQLARVFISAGRVIEAHASFNTSLELFERCNDGHGIVSALLNIAEIYRARHQYAEAISSLNRAEALCRAQPRELSTIMIPVISMMGSTLSSQGLHEEAIPYLQRGLRLTEQLHGMESTVVAGALHTMGVKLVMANDLPAGVLYLRRACAIYAKRGMESTLL